MIRPAFLVTIDTEGDNLWSRPRVVTTRNAEYLPRFQALCEKYGLKPTYLTSWEMVYSPAFRELGRDLLARRTGEIGMHLHAWNSPPLAPLTADDDRYQPFLIDYPEDQMREKVKVLTSELEDTFEVTMVSHRAGRWSFNETYARILVDHGYRVDCSVTPHVSWASILGDPNGNGGTDFSRFPDTAYFVDLNDIRRPGGSPLLELPMTIVPPSYQGVPAGRFFPSCLWLRPTRRNRKTLLYILSIARQEQRSYVEFMLHSSELMPGGSPTFPSRESIEALYDALEALFTAAQDVFEGYTLSDYYVHLAPEIYQPPS
ncbi:MAG TPA: hypothetical protein VEL49_09995 [Ktedonobacteraceae bacterium]|nr:hypothetical protein [Ktedonobacteraceae bacterium]